MGIKDSFDLAWQDWEGSAGWDRLDRPDGSPARTTGARSGPARTSSSPPARSAPGCRGWASRSSRSSAGPSAATAPAAGTATRCRASTSPWGTGPGVVAPFVRRVREHVAAGRVELRPRHRVDELVRTDGAVTGVRGRAARARRLARAACRPTATSSASSSYGAQAVVVTCGGIGGNHDLVRGQLARAARHPAGRHAHRGAGPRRRPDARHHRGRRRAVVNRDRMWHYVEGVRNWDPIWPGHAIRILPGPSSLWFDAHGDRLPAPALPRLRHPRHARPPAAHRLRPLLVHPQPRRSSARSSRCRAPSRTPTSPGSRSRTCSAGPGRMPAPVRAFLDHGADFVIADTLRELVAKMNALTPRRPARPGPHRAPGRRARPPGRQPLHQGRPGHRHPRWRGLPWRQADPRGARRTASSTPSPARSSRCGCTS